MQPLQHLPKAQAFFKEFIGLQTQNYVEKAQELSDEYLKNRQLLVEKSRTAQTKQEVRRMIRLLSHGLELPEHLRGEVQDFKGLSTQDLLTLKHEFEELLSKYGEQDSPEELITQHQEIKSQKKQIDQSKQEFGAEIADDSELPLIAAPQPNYKGWALLGLQSTGSLLVFIAIIKFVFFD